MEAILKSVLAALGVLVMFAVAAQPAGAGGPAGGGPAIRTGDYLAVVGSHATVTLETVDIAEPGLTSWGLQITFDPAIVDAVSCLTAELCNPSFAEGTATATGTSEDGITGNTTLAVFSFACLAPGTSTLDLGAAAMDAGPAGAVPDIRLEDGSITCVEAVPGDVDCDGVVNAVDAALVLQFVAGLLDDLPCAENADVNADGDVTAVDAALILQFVAGLIPALPPP